MPNRTDHAAEARNALWRSEGEPTCNAAGATLARAQVHATLALVEQQRIANIIAWTTANGAEPIESVEALIEGALGL